MSAALMTGADARAMRTTKFPDEFKKPVDSTKINMTVIRKWILDELAKLIKTGDEEIIGDTAMAVLQGSKTPKSKELYTNISGFLDKDAMRFCLALWKLCLSAQESPNGIPKELVEAKKSELIQERAAEEEARKQAMRRQAEEQELERELAHIRERDRAQRGRGGRGGRRDRSPSRSRSHDRRPYSRDSRSRSPPRRRHSPPRRTDSYVPPGRGRRGGRPWRRHRSPSYDSASPRPPPHRRRRRDTSSSISRASRSPPRRSFGDDSDVDMERGEDKDSRPEQNWRYRSRSPRRRHPSTPGDGRTSPSKRRQTHRQPASRSRSPPYRRIRDDNSRSRSMTPRNRHGRRGSRDLMSRTSRRGDRLTAPTPSREGSSRGSETPSVQKQEDRATDDMPPPKFIPQKQNRSGTEKQAVPKQYPLKISHEELKARLHSEQLEAQRKGFVVRRDCENGTPLSLASQERSSYKVGEAIHLAMGPEVQRSSQQKSSESGPASLEGQVSENLILKGATSKGGNGSGGGNSGSKIGGDSGGGSSKTG